MSNTLGLIIYVFKCVKDIFYPFSYCSLDDSTFFPAHINFSPKKRNVFTGPNLTLEDIPAKVPTKLTRRLVLQQTMAIFDPLGILSPFVLQAKLLLRATWELKLDWDEQLSDDLRDEWVIFFRHLLEASTMRYPRCLMPNNPEGDPELVLLSDGSELAYGCVAYIRYTTSDGTPWCRLIMAKSRIAPLTRVSIPQMELNGAVLSKRIRKVLEAELRIKFSKVIHLVDSKTVLHQINKLSLKCSQCAYIAPSEFKLKQHLKKEHELKNEDHTCNCGKSFSSKKQLGRHIREVHHGVKLNCDQCDYQTKRSRELKKHMELLLKR